MSEEDDGQEKTFEPTAKRVRDFRERGEVPRSNEVLSAAGLTVGFAVLYMWSANLANGMSNVFLISYNDISDHDFSVAMAEEIGGAVLGMMAYMLLPPLIFMWFGAAIVGLIQQRLAFPKEPFKFEINKLNPISGFKEKFMSSRPLVDALKSVLKLVLIGGLIAVAFWEKKGLFPALATQSPAASVDGLEYVIWLVLVRALPVAFLIATLDYAYEWYRNYEKMKMTREEVKEENKTMEGDPHAKAARKRRQQEIAYARTIQKVQTADVVITNPDHYAVALRYRRDEGSAPVVVAKGLDGMAQRIKAEARRHDIPQVENRPLARRLFRTVKQGSSIPEDLYGVVAKILAVIWQRKGRASANASIRA
jgi:flagellar biosynthetic protein FlhB